MIPSHLPIETDMNDKLTPYVIGRNNKFLEDDSISDKSPGEYKIVETIIDNDDEDELDLKQNLDEELVSLDKNVMDLYDMHKKSKKRVSFREEVERLSFAEEESASEEEEEEWEVEKIVGRRVEDEEVGRSDFQCP